ncbi:DUF4236 domain-containing protein [Kushneria sp. AK178]
MGMRFRKSIKVAPGIRLSATHRGLGVRLGGRGGGISFSPSGTRVSAGIPGTGLSWSEKIGSGSSNRLRASSSNLNSRQQEHIEIQLQIVIDDETGEVQLLNSRTGLHLDSSTLKVLKQQQGDVIRERLGLMVDNINETRESLAILHGDIQAPIAQPYKVKSFNEEQPTLPDLPSKKLVHLVWPPAEKRRQKCIELINSDYQNAISDWENSQKQHEALQESLRLRHLYGQQGDLQSMEELLKEALEEIEWPYETLIAWDFLSNHELKIDVDFPEIDMLPARRAALAARGFKVNVRKLAAKELNELYARHISSIGLKLAALCFQIMPTIQKITLSGYSQRLDRSTGHEQDEYLYSVRLNRDAWQLLNFDSPKDIDAYDCLGNFDVKRKVLASWTMKPIEPF